MRNLRASIRRVLRYPFLLSMLAVIFVIFFSFLQPILQICQQQGSFSQGFHTTLLGEAFASDGYLSVLPILAGIPYAGSYLEDIRSKYIRFLLIRGSYRSYLCSTLFACWVSGFFVILLGNLSAAAIASLVFRPLELVTDAEAIPFPAKQCILSAFAGGLWALCGLSMSTLMESRYIAYASPFILFYLLVILCERYLTGAYLLYPKAWVSLETWPWVSAVPCCFFWNLAHSSLPFSIFAG